MIRWADLDIQFVQNPMLALVVLLTDYLLVATVDRPSRYLSSRSLWAPCSRYASLAACVSQVSRYVVERRYLGIELCRWAAGT